MLEIKPCTEKAEIARYCKLCKKPYSEALYTYLATDRGRTVGAGLFEVTSDSVKVLYYETTEQEDAYLFDGVLRAGLNYASEQGITTGYIPENFRFLHKHLFAKLNYPLATSFDITNFFTKYKNCNLR